MDKIFMPASEKILEGVLFLLGQNRIMSFKAAKTQAKIFRITKHPGKYIG